MSTLTEEQIKEKCLNNLRIIRNNILNSTDKYVTPDFPHSTEEKNKNGLYTDKHYEI